MRSEKQIIGQTNELARYFYFELGCVVRKGYRFDKATHPQELAMWRMACIAQEILTDTDVAQIVAEAEC